MKMKFPQPTKKNRRRSKGKSDDDVSFLDLYLFVGFYIIIIILACLGAFDKTK